MAVNNISAEIGKSWINCGFLDTSSVGKANYLFQLLCLLWLKSGLDEVNETVSVSTQVCGFHISVNFLPRIQAQPTHTCL